MSTGFAQNGRSAAVCPEQAGLPMTIEDARADDCRRKVMISRDRVTIDRSYRGIAMRLSVPVRAYRGVCVALKPVRNGGFLYQIRLDHRDADLSVPLAEAPDDADIWADWRAWAQFFALPALIERNEGLAVWGRYPGVSQPASVRRRVKRRRAPFMARRFTRAGGATVVHRDAELIARD